MAADPDTIRCAEHGDAYATYICEHLAADPVQRWHGDYPTADNPWPDAWCARCNAEYVKEGEWNDRNEDAVSVKIACSECYENARGRSVERLSADALDAWTSFVSDCCAELQRKQDGLNAAFALSRHERWDWDQEEGELIWSNGGVAAVVARVEFVGSVSSTSSTWLWSWANVHIHDNVKRRITVVRELGEEMDFPRLTVPKWTATEADGWDMTAIAARVLDARGAYRTRDENGFMFMLITDIRRVGESET